jgi:acyl-CoA synthetase (AMP-forming)/AMP-acid ligase II
MIEFDPVLVHDWLRRSARRFPDKVALVCGQQRWTYGQLDRHSDHLAAALLNIGLQRQDRVVILLDNSAETVISLYGTLKAGGVFVILASSIKAVKLKYILENSDACILITHTDKAKVVCDALSNWPKDCKVIWVGQKSAIPEELSRSSVNWDDLFSAQNSEIRNQKSEICPLSYRCGPGYSYLYIRFNRRA